MKKLSHLLILTLLLLPGLNSFGQEFCDSVLFDEFTMTFGSLFDHNTPTTVMGKHYKCRVEGDYAIWTCCTESGTGSPRLDAAYKFATDDSDPTYKRINWCWNGVTPLTDTTLFRPDNDIYQSSHIYWFSFTGDGTSQNFCFWDDAYGDNSGSLQFEIYEMDSMPSVAATASDTILCYGEELTLTGEGAVDYEWDYDVIDGEEFIPEIGEYLYTVIGTDDNGCSDTASLEVTVYETLTITAITADETLGGDGSIDVTVTGGNPAYTFDWDNDGTGDFDDTEDLTGLSGGDYTVVINCSAGCNATQTITVNSQLGIHGDQGGNLAIYPNPTSNLVTITLEGLFVYSLVGVNGAVLVTKKSINQAQLDLSEFADGIYFLEIQSENGSETVKLLKQ